MYQPIKRVRLRDFLVKAAQAARVQIAAPVGEGQGSHAPEAQWADLIDSIRAAYPQPAQWSYYSSDWSSPT